MNLPVDINGSFLQRHVALADHHRRILQDLCTRLTLLHCHYPPSACIPTE